MSTANGHELVDPKKRGKPDLTNKVKLNFKIIENLSNYVNNFKI